MANHASALKRARQSEKRYLRNKAYRTRVRNVIKLVREAIDNKDKEGAFAALKLAEPILNKAASKGVFRKKNISRKLSRLTKQSNVL